MIEIRVEESSKIATKSLGLVMVWVSRFLDEITVTSQYKLNVSYRFKPSL